MHLTLQPPDAKACLLRQPRAIGSIRDDTQTVGSDAFIASVSEIGSLVVGLHEGRPVYLRDIAQIIDGPEEARNYSRIGFSNFYAKDKFVSHKYCCRSSSDAMYYRLSTFRTNRTFGGG